MAIDPLLCINNETIYTYSSSFSAPRVGYVDICVKTYSQKGLLNSEPFFIYPLNLPKGRLTKEPKDESFVFQFQY